MGVATHLVFLPQCLQKRLVGREVFAESVSLCGQQGLLLQDPAVLHAMVVPLLLQSDILLLRHPVRQLE